MSLLKHRQLYTAQCHMPATDNILDNHDFVIYSKLTTFMEKWHKTRFRQPISVTKDSRNKILGMPWCFCAVPTHDRRYVRAGFVTTSSGVWYVLSWHVFGVHCLIGLPYSVVLHINSLLWNLFNLLWLSVAVWCQTSWSVLFQEIACHLLAYVCAVYCFDCKAFFALVLYPPL